MSTTRNNTVLTAVAITAIALLSGCLGTEREYDTAELEALNASADVLLQTQTEEFGNELNATGVEQQAVNQLVEDIEDRVTNIFVYPVENYVANTTKKTFGQFIEPSDDDRFSGFHTGDDIEVPNLEKEVIVVAIATGTIVAVEEISGYGGVLIQEFTYEEQVYHALYGHIDLDSVAVQVDQVVSVGDELAVLGDHESDETDGERKHLHFGIYPYFNKIEYAGYVDQETLLNKWENPTLFLQERFVTDQFESDSSAETTASQVENDLTEAVQNALQ